MVVSLVTTLQNKILGNQQYTAVEGGGGFTLYYSLLRRLYQTI